jgi:hypothetical protein
MAKKNLPEKLTADEVLNPEFFRSDLEDMYASIEDIRGLATKIDTDLDDKYFNSENRNLYGRGTLTFASKQMETLATLHASKNTAINQAMRAKLDLAKLELQKQKSTEDSADTAVIAREFQKLFLEHKSDIADPKKQFVAQSEASKKTTSQDLDLEKRLNSLEQSGELQYTDNEIAIQYEKRGVQIKVQNLPTPHFVAVAGDNGEILKDYPKTLLPKDSLLEKAVQIDGGIWRLGAGQDYYSI